MLTHFAAQLSRQIEDLAIAQGKDEPDAVIKARCYVCAHLDEPLTVREVARYAGISSSHFCRVFRAATGLTLIDYITRLRIVRAKRELLCTSGSVSDVAFKVGFQSLSQFNRSFARHVGCSPSGYRSAHRAE